MIVNGTTKDGYNYSIESDLLKDWRFCHLIARTMKPKDEHDSIITQNALVELLIGEDNIDAFAGTIAKSNNGLVPVQAVSDALVEIINALKNDKDVKN